MKKFALLLLLAAGFAAAPLLPARAAPHGAGHALSASDRVQLFRATALAGRSTPGAVSWLQHRGVHVTVGRDGTASLQFSDGAQAAILPRTTITRDIAAPIRTVTHFAPHTVVRQSTGANKRALVLEPFADQLYPDNPNTAGQDEVTALTQAGFHVDVKRDTEVTIDLMQHLADYSFVYMETHSNPLPDTGDVIIVVRQTDNQDYTSYFQDGTVQQATVAGDPAHSLFLALKSAFFAKHVGKFADSSIFFLNGCDVLGSPKLLQALQQQNLGVLISWDQEVYSYREAGPLVLQKLAQGETVAQTVEDVRNAGPGISIGPGTLAKLDYNGDGSDTLARALLAAPVPTATPTATLTPTVTPTATPKPLHTGKCRPGHHRVHGKCQPIKKCMKKKHCKKV